MSESVKSTTFPAKARTGGSSEKSLIIYVPKQVVYMLSLKRDTQLEVTVKVMEAK